MQSLAHLDRWIRHGPRATNCWIRLRINSLERTDILDTRQREVGLLRYWADLLCEQGKVAEAELLYLRGLEISQKFAINDFWTRQWLAMGMSELRKNQGRLAEAEEFARQALEFARKSTRFSEIARALVSLGLVLKGQGNSAQAERLYREAIDACKKSSDLGQLVGATGCLADLLNEQGKHTDAEALYHQALEVNQKFFPEDSGTRRWLVEGLDLSTKAQGSKRPKESSPGQSTIWAIEPAAPRLTFVFCRL